MSAIDERPEAPALPRFPQFRVIPLPETCRPDTARVQHGWERALIVASALFAVLVDQSLSGAFSQALPYVQGELGAAPDEASWLTIGYNVCYYLSIITTPWLVCRFGRRTVFAAGLATMGLASLLCAAATSYESLAILRGFEGIGQGTLFTSAALTILTIFPPASVKWGFAMFSACSLSGPALGPLFGGTFADEASWRAFFAVVGVLALFATLPIAFFLAPAEDAPTMPFDPIGFTLLACHFATYHYIIAYGERRDWLWEPSIFYGGIVFVITSAAFIAWELIGTNRPFIKLRLFREHNLQIGAILGMALGIPLFGATIFLQYLQNQLHFTPELAGSLLALRVIAIVVTVPFTSLILSSGKVDVRYLIVAGFVLVAGSYAYLGENTTSISDFGTFALAMVISGFGFALLFSPIAFTVLNSIPKTDLLRGAAIFKLSLTTGGSLASTALAVLVDHRGASHLATLASGATTGSASIHASQLAALVASQASVLAYGDSNKWTAVAVVLTVPLALLLRPIRRPG
jgi:DHA2 family multidrug resistance protein